VTAAVPPAVGEHVERCLDAMRERDVDVLVLGREANARYVSGATRLWLAGTRPFNPGCVVVRETGAVHLLSVTDDLVPLPPERLYAMSWNPANILGALRAIPGVEHARRIGVDGMTPLFERLLHATLPDAEIVDGEALVASVRRRKSPADVRGIQAAVAVAEHALGEVLATLHAGMRERDLVAAFAEATTARGVTTPAFEAVVTVVGDDPAPSFPGDRRVADGDLVDASVGVIAWGWEGRLARTWPCGAPTAAQRDAYAACEVRRRDVASRIRPGVEVGELRASGALLTGVGTGDELLPDAVVVEPGFVMAVGVRADGVHVEDVVAVTDAGLDVLTTSPRAPV
jgi:Xaa-Pro aminopeptidase